MDRYEIVDARVESLIGQLRLIRKRVKEGRHIDPSDFGVVNEILSSLRHNCEMHNEERVTEK